MARININGTSLEYSECGRGEPLVLVHGSASDCRTWRCQFEEFGSRFRTINYSRRYHWPNAQIAEEADYSMSEQLDDLRALLLSLDAAPAHLVGHSYGAFLCLLLAMREPDLGRTLVLAEPPVLPLFVSLPPRPLEILRLLASRPRTAAAIMKFGATGIGPTTKALGRGDTENAVRIFGSAVLGPEAFGRLSDERREQVRVNFMKAEFLGSGFLPLNEDQVHGLRAPALLVTGEKSPSLFHCLADRLNELIPQSERIDIPGASHIVHEDNAPVFNAAVLRYLSVDRAGS